MRMVTIDLTVNLALLKRGLVSVRFLSRKRVRLVHSFAYYCSFQVSKRLDVSGWWQI